MKSTKLNIMTKTAILSVIGFLIMFIEVPIPIFPSFLKIDVSDLPALIGAFALGPVAGIIIELLKNILHGIFNGQTAFIGEFANFVVGAIFVGVAGAIYKRKKTRTNALIGLAIGTIVMSIGAGILNYFVILPLYETVLHFPISAVVGMGSKLNPAIKNLNTFIVFSILPFNLIKGVIASVITMAVYKAVSPLIHKEAEKIEAVQNKA
ncbi:ECF transporter S component [Clostridium pasteurianum]|uniref:Riboflavin transporter n=1 Tax=Clostridium pasteurianum BC1 TaxID=86416 RepID=R4KHG5_CLOPA|nr:ECF transporter S component [Clostridium pasteurianum]AGK99045.1 putative membrane protein [Clostridium pasteurianum BC1]